MTSVLDRANEAGTLLVPARLPDHIDVLYRAARSLCRSRADAEDLVQDTFVRVLKRPRFVRRNHELAYLVRVLRNTHASGYRTMVRRPVSVALPDDVAWAAPEPSFQSDEIMRAIASAPIQYRDAVIAVDVVGLSYEEAAHALRAPKATITTRLHRGRQHVARALGGED